MDWFKRKKQTITAGAKKELPDGLWIKCDNCGDIIYKKELEKKLFVCPKCDYHFRIGHKEYIQILFDENTFEEFNAHLMSTDPLQFVDSKPYIEKYKATVKKTGMNEAVVTGTGKLDGHGIVAALMDFKFLGGSMGSVVGEKVARAIDKALELKQPLIILSSSGGARMHEGIFSLMQMAKTSAKLALLAENKIPYISILTNPTTGGTTASYAMLGDINLAEPGALIGFAGPRVIKQTIGQDLPPGFQRSEFVMEHGFLDMIVHRHQLKQKISQLLDFFAHQNPH
ncbi:MAG TPA: acetyl-CoA carboxylase carboxyltransferase subunit beta [Caldithrix abyssi]|uniref:Acetyl-coenzyme A carboxylase carboxyl transferase subunit beta n=1 Tax=Caldithrix abyssi TaxID=187145 RepID=A0A7V5LHQ9_CALAY|nr:acetyl-CoA carboxylase carboxyltransferase subunit beta [Caldisericaceae bacterium]HHE54203.1 acetyl-CoA carboxylase carboxyltransferase subunit beta [Caldithrix abyssi]